MWFPMPRPYHIEQYPEYVHKYSERARKIGCAVIPKPTAINTFNLLYIRRNAPLRKEGPSVIYTVGNAFSPDVYHEPFMLTPDHAWFFRPDEHELLLQFIIHDEKLYAEALQTCGSENN